MSCGCSTDLKLCLPVGTSPIWAIALIDPDNAGIAVNIAGTTFAFFVKESAADADADAAFSLTSAGDEIVITSASGGLAQIHNTVAKSSELTAGRVYRWTLRATFSTGEIRTIRSGSLEAESA